MLYRQIASAMDEISSLPRSQKAALCSRLIAEIEAPLLCPLVRLLLGQLWPPWEAREMGVGPEGISAALAEISEEDITALRGNFGEMGQVAEAALEEKGQNSLTIEPLQDLSVYEQLRRISQIRGKDSEQRKNALLRGLFQEASPLEGRYIARTVLGNNLTGIGHKTMLSAFALAFGCERSQLHRAYSLLPDPGMIAVMAAGGKLEEARIQPGIPIKPMVICPLKAEEREAEDIKGREPARMRVLPQYHALKVQVHNTAGGTYIFSSRQKNITSSLNGLAQRLSRMDEEFIIDADLIGFRDGRICPLSEIIRFINRRRLSRRSSLSPALLAYDLLYHSGEDITTKPFLERRRRLLEALGEPKPMPFSVISVARDWDLPENYTNKYMKDRLGQLAEEGGEGLMLRSLQGFYRPGECSKADFIVAREARISAVIVRAECSPKRKDNTLSRFQVALREGDELISVGWIGGQLSRKDALELDRLLKGLAREWDDNGATVIPQVIVNLRIGGARRIEQGYLLLRPVVVGIDPQSSWEEADDLERLIQISGL